MKTTKLIFTCLMILLYSEISLAFTASQDNWRWRNDDGDVYSATWKDSSNFPIILSVTDTVNLRLRVKLLFVNENDTTISFPIQYSEHPGIDPWIPINNLDTGKFFISSSNYLIDTMSYFDNELLPPHSGSSYVKTITLDSTDNYTLKPETYSAYEVEYSLKPTAKIDSGAAYFFSIFPNSEENYYENPVIMTKPISWIPQHSGIQYPLTSVFFTDENIGWTVGIYGTILHTTNGGNIWTPQYSGISFFLKSVRFIDGNTGWIVGSGGEILHTTNGGTDWTPQTSGTTAALWNVCFIDGNIGWTVGYNGTILHTTTGGDIWTPQSSGNTNTLLSVFFTDENIGWTVGIYGTILHTTNGGDTWTPQTSGTTNHLLSVFFINENTGWIVGSDGTILHTANGGGTWSPQTSGTMFDLTSVYFIDENNGTAVGSHGTILRTTDAGINWESQASGTIKELDAVSFIDANNGWIVGKYGKILRSFNPGGIPVELTSFTAQSNGNNVLFNWSTATEINNRGFEIQRSSDNSEYIRIGFVEGNGSTTEEHTYSYTDKKLNNGKYYYRLKQIDFDGSYEYLPAGQAGSNVVEVMVNAPIGFSLQQNYPNPFNPATTIKYTVQEKSYLTLKIYDILGSEVETLINEEKPAGIYEFTWYAANMPSGIYFYQLKAGSYVDTKKMILLK